MDPKRPKSPPEHAFKTKKRFRRPRLVGSPGRSSRLRRLGPRPGPPPRAVWERPRTCGWWVGWGGGPVAPPYSLIHSHHTLSYSLHTLSHTHTLPHICIHTHTHIYIYIYISEYVYACMYAYVKVSSKLVPPRGKNWREQLVLSFVMPKVCSYLDQPFFILF